MGSFHDVEGGQVRVHKELRTAQQEDQLRYCHIISSILCTGLSIYAGNFFAMDVPYFRILIHTTLTLGVPLLTCLILRSCRKCLALLQKRISTSSNRMRWKAVILTSGVMTTDLRDAQNTVILCRNIGAL